MPKILKIFPWPMVAWSQLFAFLQISFFTVITRADIREPCQEWIYDPDTVQYCMVHQWLNICLRKFLWGDLPGLVREGRRVIRQIIYRPWWTGYRWPVEGTDILQIFYTLCTLQCYIVNMNLITTYYHTIVIKSFDLYIQISLRGIYSANSTICACEPCLLGCVKKQNSHFWF